MFYEAVSTVVHTELSREVISSLPWQYIIEAETHSKCGRFICLSHCRKTAVSMEITQEGWWAKTGTLPSSSPAPTLVVHPTLFHAKCRPSPFGQGYCFCFQSVAPPQPHTTPWSCALQLSSWRHRKLSAGPWEAGGTPGHSDPPFCYLWSFHALCYFHILPWHLTARGA